MKNHSILTKPAILVVDDVPDIVEEMIHMLELIDLPAMGARSIAAAISVLVGHPDIRLLICDLRLSGENGADIGLHIASHPQLRNRYFDIIFMSGDAERLDALAVGPGQVIMTKPIDLSLLIDMILDCLNADRRCRAAAG